MKNFIICLVLTGLSNFVIGQEKWDLGTLFGKTNYLGDLVDPSFTFAHSEFSGGLFLRYQIVNQFKVRSNLLLGSLIGNDENYTSNSARMASFKTSFLELSILGEYDLFDLRIDGKKRMFTEKISPYAFAGLGFTLINPEISFGSSSMEISVDRAAQYSDIQAVVPIGLGVKYNLVKNVTIGAEAGIHFLFTDYVDGVSEAGEPGNMDQYVSWNITFAYRLGNTDADRDGIVDKKDKCPDIAGPAKYQGCPDSDGDGLPDSKDDCPMDAGKALLKGCPDSDNDGVSDFVDDCPDDPGIRRLGGCPDTDNDGIVDPEDNCPTEAGIPSLNGCPDIDRDGVTDSKDDCPLEPGSMLLNGCPDQDGDGIIDKLDECPFLPGSSQTQGCPDEDKDNDGIIDRKDRCPELAGPEDNAGCPEIKQEDQAVLDFAMTNVEFATGSNALTEASQEILNLISGILNKYKGYRLQINGHTDNIGEPFKNKLLSEDRARSCYDYLISRGVNPSLISFTGFGDTQPIAENDTEEGRRQNRRVEFILTTEGK